MCANRRYYATRQESRMSAVAKSIERLGEHRRRDRADPRDFVSLHQLRIMRHQKEILIAEASQVMKAVRGDDHRGATVTLRFKGGA